MASGSIEGELKYVHETKKTIIDVRTFKEHETKEVEVWTWSKVRHDKFIVFSDCINKKIQMRKLK